MHLSRYLKIYPSVTKPGYYLLFSTLRSSTVLVPGATLEAARNGTLGDSEKQALTRLGMLVEDLDQEREQMRSLLERNFSNNPALKAMVVLNLDCNLDCGYCFEKNFRGDMYMSEATAELLVNAVIRDYISKGIDAAITFYGGEPLLSQDLIRKISVPLQEAAKEHNVNYSFGLVTNGTLLNRQTAESLLPSGFRGAKFTLDGPQEIHDRQRPYASGSGSFDAIVENIDAVSGLIDIIIGGNFYPDNYREFPRLLDHLIGRGITPDKVAHVQFTPIVPEAGSVEHTGGCLSSCEPWLMEALPFLREETMARGFATTKTSLSACVIEHPNMLVVNYDGSLYKCPAFMGNNELCIGNLVDGVSDYSESHGIGNWKTDECLDCSYLPLCFGGCRFMSQLQGKPMSAVDCLKEFLDATLEKMILQNMAYPQRSKPSSQKP